MDKLIIKYFCKYYKCELDDLKSEGLIKSPKDIENVIELFVKFIKPLSKDPENIYKNREKHIKNFRRKLEEAEIDYTHEFTDGDMVFAYHFNEVIDYYYGVSFDVEEYLDIDNKEELELITNLVKYNSNVFDPKNISKKAVTINYIVEEIEVNNCKYYEYKQHRNDSADQYFRCTNIFCEKYNEIEWSCYSTILPHNQDEDSCIVCKKCFKRCETDCA